MTTTTESATDFPIWFWVPPQFKTIDLVSSPEDRARALVQMLPHNSSAERASLVISQEIAIQRMLLANVQHAATVCLRAEDGTDRLSWAAALAAQGRTVAKPGRNPQPLSMPAKSEFRANANGSVIDCDLLRGFPGPTPAQPAGACP